MPSDTAKSQVGTPPIQGSDESTSPKAGATSAPPVSSDVPPEQQGSESCHPLEVEPEPMSDRSPTTGGPSASAEPMTIPPVVHPSPAGQSAPDPPQVADLKTPVLLQLPSSALTVNIKRDYLRDVGTLLVAIAAVVIAVLAYMVNRKQAESLDIQSRAADRTAEAATDEANIKFIEEFRKHLVELTLPDDPQKPDYEDNRRKKTLAAITLAQYGKRALPALKMSLTVEDDLIRDSAAVVVVQMLTDKELRATVFSELLKYFDENNVSLRAGVLECLVVLYRDLTPTELGLVKAKLRQHISPDSDYSGKLQEQDVLLRSAKFFGNWPSRDSTHFLLAVAKNHTCGNDPREQAMNYLPSAVKGAKELSREQSEALRATVIADLQRMLPEAPERLKVNLSNAIGDLQGQ